MAWLCKQEKENGSNKLRGRMWDREKPTEGSAQVCVDIGM